MRPRPERTHTSGRGLLASIVALGCLLSSAPSLAETSFVVLGDMPYGRDQIHSLRFIGSKLQDPKFPFIIHYGDVKAGGKVGEMTSEQAWCSDSVLAERKDVIYGLKPGAVFYTPGDNDWTDCDRPEAGGFDETQRLTKLREIFFAEPDLPSNDAWAIARQGPDYPENARWQHDGIQFVTLHVVGTDNGRREIMNSDVDKALAAVARRDQANLEWLKAAFDEANRTDAQAWIVVLHGDPFDITDRTHRSRACDAAEPVDCNPYLALLQRLTSLADAFDRPVLLVHGSTNQFCIDRGFGGWRAPKLWRLNGPGDFVTVDAAIVQVDPAASLPFGVHGLLSGDTVPSCHRR